MNDKYLEFIDSGSAFLEHHGILGMHWGVRRTPAQLGYKKAQKTKRKMEKEAARKQKIMRDPKLLSKHAKEFSDVELAQALNRFRTQEQISSFTNKPKKESSSGGSKALDPAKAARRLEKQKAKAERKRMKLQAKLDEKAKQKDQDRKDKNQPKKEEKKMTVEQKLQKAANMAGSASKLTANLVSFGKTGRALTDELGLTKKNENEGSLFSGWFSKQNYKKGEGKKDQNKPKGDAKDQNKQKDSGSDVNIVINNINSILNERKDKNAGSDSWMDPKNWEVKKATDYAWYNKDGSLDKRRYGPNTKLGKKLKKQSERIAAQNGADSLDAIFGALASATDTNSPGLQGGRVNKNNVTDWYDLEKLDYKR